MSTKPTPKPALVFEVVTSTEYRICFDDDQLIALCKAELIRRINEEHGIDLSDMHIESEVPYDPFYVQVSTKVTTT